MQDTPEHDDLDPDSIGNQKPKWEPFKDAIDREERFQTERSDILEFQEKLDHARERSDSDDFSKDELDELSADLEASVPDAVAQHLPEDHPALQKQQLQKNLAARHSSQP